MVEKVTTYNTSSQAIRGVFWNNLASYVDTGVRFMGGIYLARKIDPVYFGQAGLAYSMVVIIGVATMFGQEYAIIRQRESVNRFVGTQLTLRMLAPLIICAILVMVWRAKILPIKSEIQYYALLLYVTLAIMQITAIYTHYMQKMWMFRRLALINIAVTVASFALACSLAYYGYKIWVLLWLWMSTHLLRAFFTMIFTPRRILPCFDLKMAIQFFQYGRFIFVTTLMSRVHGKIDDISIGTLVGNAALGFYQRAYGLCGLLQQVVTGGVMAVSGPVFGKMRGDRARLGRNFELIGSLVLRIAIGGYVWMALIIPDLIALMYGEKWLPAVPLFRLMLPYALVQSFSVILRDTHFIAGKPSLVARIEGIELGSLSLLLFPLLLWKQAAGAAVAVDVSAIIGLGLLLYYLKPLGQFSIRRLFTNPLFAACISFAVFYFVADRLPVTGRLSRLAWHTSLFWIVFSGTLLLLEFGFWKRIYVRIRQAMTS